MKLLLIDGNSILNRAFYGVKILTSSTGLYTNAIFGFTNILSKHISETNPDGVAVAFDMKAKTFRHLAYDGYKGSRKGMPEELAVQLEPAKKIAAAMGAAVIEREGIEADDIIGILSMQNELNGGTNIIVTGDRDSFQLITDKTTVMYASTKGDLAKTPETIKEEYGLTPSQLIELKAIMGDSSDDIPGVPGIGPKSATPLLVKYGSLDEIYRNIDEITPKGLNEKLRSGKESAYMSRYLGTILRQVPEGSEPLTAPTGLKKDTRELKKLFTEYQMYSFIDRLCDDENRNSCEIQAELPEITVKEFSSDDIPEDPIYVLDNGNGILVKGKTGIMLATYDEAHSVLMKRKFITDDSKHLMRRLNDSCLEPVFDTMICAYILNPSKSSYGLKESFSEILGENRITPEDQLNNMNRLTDKMKELMEKDGSSNLYYSIELPLSRTLCSMELEGVLTDGKFLREFGDKLDREIEELSQAISSYTDHPVNLKSPKQLAEFLFDDLGLKEGKKTKTGRSTDIETLESLIDEHPVIELIIQYRKVTKLKSTYVDGLLKEIRDDGRIHTEYTQTVTQTGRISSVEPNLQNIPVRTDTGRELRKAFYAKDGCVLVDADYSQIELRIMAHISGDENLIEAFRSGEDIHTKTASRIMNLPVELITPELRRRAKAINFGIIYGIGPYSLSKDLGITVKEASKYIDEYFSVYPGVKEYVDSTVEFAKKEGYVTTLFGRIRKIPELRSAQRPTRAFGERVSMNTPIQGTAADLIKLAMVRVDERLRREGLKTKLILQIHDELILEAPEEEADKAAEILKEEMENAHPFCVPIIADVHSARSWFDIK